MGGKKHCWKKFDGLTCHTYTKILEAWPSVSPLFSVGIFFASSLR